MSEEVFALVAFFVLMALLVPRIVREERERVACADQSGLEGATLGSNELRSSGVTSQDVATSSPPAVN